ncbi:ATP-binding cassette domain-containing protein [Sulfurimonas sp.]|uniref:ABC transporter ATP-binding protein/permease n=1 Tax=Sulfurimonas sp. TaxID=2022749 RepID=UPI0025F487A2|nr:ATP-binding cassette domain-containing protein [Sulfurimonas sp.]MDD5156708.1 ATP-binding cassette domain-containing protein [Sulfurimonas sp.]
MIKKLRSLLTKRDKQLLLGLLFFSIFISVVETAGISVIMPFIAVATDFTIIHSNQYYKFIYDFFNFKNDVKFVISFGSILILFYIFRSFINLAYFYFLNRFTQGRYHLLVYRLFENYMGLPYNEFIKRNSSTLTKSIISEAANLTNLISAVLFMMSEIFIVIFIYLMMLYVNYKITLLLTIILFFNAVLMMKSVAITIKKAGTIRADIQKRFYEIINRSFGNFKLIKLSLNDSEILKEFSDASLVYAKSNITHQTLSHVPRLFLEAVGFGLIIFIISYLVYKYETNISGMLSIISMFILALYRLMPSVSRIMTSYNQIMFYHKSLDIIHNDLMYDSENLGDEEINFNDQIELRSISFEYEENKSILKNISLVIKKGQKIAFVGESGSGKSTLLDLIMGLYRPKNGAIVVDGVTLDENNIKTWRHKIGYIPQSIYLFDGTVAQNVAFGKSFDEDKIKDALQQANILEFLEINHNGIDTDVGEGGIKLSGGQRQRIAIARTLYSDPEILVLDEATSALDTDTEAKIMEEIYKIRNDKTLIVIAHRLSTIEGCETVYKIEGNVLVHQQITRMDK